MTKPIIIIGSGLAGYNLAREIRAHDKTVPVIMITRDAGDFYSKPMLSTALFMGKTADALITMSAQQMAEQYSIEILTHTEVTDILPEYNVVHTTQHRLEYRSLVLCTGADTHIPSLEGDAQADILQVNDVYQYKIFREKIYNKKKIVLLGAGLVGCEFANDLTRAGYDVHIVEPAPTPLASLLPTEIGTQLMKALEKQGACWYLGHTAQSIHHQPYGYRITLDDDSTILADVVFSAIGLKPRVSLAKKAGIQTNRGICVNEYLRTNVENIYAMGDCCEINHWLLPYIAPIMQSSKTLAMTLAGSPSPVSLPAMPVMIKTSCYPTAVCCPPDVQHRDWRVSKVNDNLRAELKNENQQLVGFILTGDAVKERASLAPLLPKWFISSSF